MAPAVVLLPDTRLEGMSALFRSIPQNSVSAGEADTTLGMLRNREGNKSLINPPVKRNINRYGRHKNQYVT